MTLTPQEVTEILKHLENSQCEEFHLQLGDTSLTLRRGVAGGAAPQPAVAPPRPKAPAAEAAATPEPAQPAGKPAPQAPPATSAGEADIVAPMGGTFYRRPSPEEPPYVEEGAMVQPGDPVCMIEVMKLFSTVYAERAGRVVAVLVEDSATVEQDQPLFRIDPA